MTFYLLQFLQFFFPNNNNTEIPSFFVAANQRHGLKKKKKEEEEGDVTWLRKQGAEYGMKGGFGEEVGTVELWPDIGGGWGTRRYPRGVWLAPVTPRHRLNGAACPLFWHQTDSAHSSFSFAASP